jgi:ComF family protein
MRAASTWLQATGVAAGRTLLDFALPPRCAGCGEIVGEVGLFCTACWNGLEFLGNGCDLCGLPLRAGEVEHCTGCSVATGPTLRIRAAIAYGEVPRSIAMRLKYGRKIALARVMAAQMKRPFADLAPDALLVPVPLHRWRLWQRGFNQAVLIARALGREMNPDLLRRTRATPRLKGLDPSQRRKVVDGAFAVRPGASIKGKKIILVDDVLTTGATAEACAKALRKAGAAGVELIAFARVLPDR